MVEKEDVRQGYDDLAGTYAEEREAEGDGLAALDRLLERVPTNGRVLDAGCGQGVPILEWIDERVTGVGLDISRGQLRLAAENVPDVPLSQGDLARLPFESAVFDAVTAYYSLIHVPEGEHRAVLDECARVLRPGGRILVIEGTNEWRGSNPDWLDSGVEMQWHIAGPEATRSQLRSAGFEITDESVVGSSLPEESGWQLFEAVLEE